MKPHSSREDEARVAGKAPASLGRAEDFSGILQSRGRGWKAVEDQFPSGHVVPSAPDCGADNQAAAKGRRTQAERARKGGRRGSLYLYRPWQYAGGQ